MSSPLILPNLPVGKPRAVDLPPERCGNCWYSEKIPGGDPAMVFCQGGPPTAIMVGMAQDALGRPQPQMLSFWPSTQKTQRRCALYAPAGPKDAERVS